MIKETLRIVKKTLYMMNATISSYMWYMQLNANKDIKEAEKIMAKYHTARMATKGGMGSDKSPLVEKMSAAYNAYIVGTISYTAQDAALRAHTLHVKQLAKRTQACLVLQLLINIVTAIVIGSVWKIPLMVAITALLVVTPPSMRGMLTHALSILNAPSLMAATLEMVYCMVIYTNIVPSSFRWIAGGVYCITASILIFW